MDADLALVGGILLIGISIPGLLSSLSERRGSRASAIIVFLGVALISVAMYTQPGGYTFDQLPDVFVRVFNRFTP